MKCMTNIEHLQKKRITTHYVFVCAKQATAKQENQQTHVKYQKDNMNKKKKENRKLYQHIKMKKDTLIYRKKERNKASKQDRNNERT